MNFGVISKAIKHRHEIKKGFMKSRYILFLLITLWTNNGFSQQFSRAKADSLKQIWSNPLQPDTVRLKVLGDFIWGGYIYNLPDSAIYFANLQYNLAESVGNKNFMASALNNLGVCYRFKGDFFKSIDYHQKNIKIFEETGNKKMTKLILSKYGKQFHGYRRLQ